MSWVHHCFGFMAFLRVKLVSSIHSVNCLCCYLFQNCLFKTSVQFPSWPSDSPCYFDMLLFLTLLMPSFLYLSTLKYLFYI